VARRLAAHGHAVRVGSWSGRPPFDWQDRATWAPALHGVGAAYLSYYPDLAAPGAAETTGAFARLAVSSGVSRLVLLAGRGEPETEVAEQAVRESGAELTIVRAAWFNQNFSEDFLLGPVLAGEVALPAGEVPEPFVDADDIAEVAVAALTQDGHAGQLYELTGPRLLTFAEAVGEIAAAAGRPISYLPVPPPPGTLSHMDLSRDTDVSPARAEGAAGAAGMAANWARFWAASAPSASAASSTGAGR